MSYVDQVKKGNNTYDIQDRRIDSFPANPSVNGVYLLNNTMWNNQSTKTWSDAEELVNLHVVTYSEIVSLRTNGSLIPGALYLISDYACTTTETDTLSAGHVFDIVVVADSKTALNENARAVIRDGDSYFKGCNLNAWKLKYCLDNDTYRFSWADDQSGKGVIYDMIDEYGNQAPYDFKNIMYNIGTQAEPSYVYTFTCSDGSSIMDASLYGYKKLCYNNKIERYYEEHDGVIALNHIYMVTDTETELVCYDNSFGANCYSITMGYNSCCNEFGAECHGIDADYGFKYNRFASRVSNCNFGHNCMRNSFGAYSSNITFGDICNANSIGVSNVNITFGNSCQYITTGSTCIAIKTGDANSTINHCNSIEIDTGCKFIYLLSDDTTATAGNPLRNVKIHYGVSGTSASNRLTISVADRNLAYSTDFYAAGSQEIILGGNN